MRRKLFVVSIILISVLILCISCKKKNNPPDTPEILGGPSNGYAGAYYNFTVLASDLNGDSIAYQFNWGSGDADTSNWSNIVASDDQLTMSNVWLSSGTYFIKSRAKDTKGAISLWSEPDTIVILPNNIPNIPSSPTGPDSGDVGIPYTFTVSATDPDGDSVCYIYDWADGLIDSSCFCQNGDTISLEHSWASGGTYLVKAQTKDSKGAISDWSGVSQVAVHGTGNSPPRTPNYVAGPEQGYIYYGYWFSTSTTDPDDDSIVYQFDFGNGDTWQFNNGRRLPSGAVGWGSTKFKPDIGTFYIRARAMDTKGAISNWSPAKPIKITFPDIFKWRYLTGGAIISSPAIDDDGTIYFGSLDSYLYALNPNGTLKWRYLTGGEVYSSPSIGPDGAIYFGSCDNRFYALNPDGSLKWTYLTRNKIVSSPAIASDGTIYFSSDDSCVYALNPDGSLKWSFPINCAAQCSPAIGSDGTIYFGSGQGLIQGPISRGDGYYAVNPDGTLKWHFASSGSANLYSSAIGRDGTIYTALGETLYAFNPDGSVKWAIRLFSTIYSSVVIDDYGCIYFGGGFQSLYPDGTLKYSYSISVHPTAALSEDNLIYIGGLDYHTGFSFFALKLNVTNPRYEDIAWKFNVEFIFSSASIGQDGTVYFGTCIDDPYIEQYFYFYALKGSAPLARTPWPKFQHDLKNTGRVGGP